ncbi:MAG: TIGR04255 family protein [Minisyncoccales bacterium]
MEQESKQYKNPPIQEAVCEFRFGLEQNPGQIQIGEIFNKIKDRFPVTKKGNFHEVSVKIDIKENKKDLIDNVREFDRFFSVDEKSLVQINNNKLSIHRLKPYTSWQEFLSAIELVFNTYLTVVKIKSIQRIGLRYINAIEMGSSFEIEEYFNLRPNIVAELPQNLSDFNAGVVFVMGNGTDGVKAQLSNQWLSSDKQRIILDLDYFLGKPDVVKNEEVLGWLKVAHQSLENIFETAITEKTKFLFN